MKVTSFQCDQCGELVMIPGPKAIMGWWGFLDPENEKRDGRARNHFCDWKCLSAWALDESRL